MQRGEPVFWLLFAMSAFGLAFPHLAAGAFEDPRPLRWMALAVFLATGALLADTYLFGGVLGHYLTHL